MAKRRGLAGSEALGAKRAMGGRHGAAPSPHDVSVKRQQTRLDHERRIVEAVAYLLANLDDPVELDVLADTVCLSRFHFHRVFQALMGETVGELARRLRLERAAHALRTTNAPITMIAFEASYATLEAFIRAFRAAFGYTPSVFRKEMTYSGHLPTRNGVHFDDPGCERLRFVASTGEPNMDIEVREFAPRRVVAVPHKGPYYMIGQSFSVLGQVLGEAKIEHDHGVGIFYDDACATPADQLRSHAGAFVADDVTVDDPRVEMVDFSGGLYAVVTHVGPYDGLVGAWGAFYGWLPQSCYELVEGLSFEVYLNDCSVTPPEELRTEICVHVKAPVIA